MFLPPGDVRQAERLDEHVSRFDTRFSVIVDELFGEMMPGVVSVPHGFGHVYSGTRQTTATSNAAGKSANDLIDDSTLDVPSGTSVVNGVPVNVRPIERASH